MSDHFLWIQNGRVIDPANDKDETSDLFVADGKIVNDLSPAEKEKAEIIDAEGLVVAPGIVDIHVHLREPGQTHKETIETGSWAAAAGGVTTMVCMPNTAPPADNAGTIQLIQDVIARKAIVTVYPTGCLTLGRKGEALAPIGSLKKAGVIAITDDGDCIQNNELMRRAAEYGSMFNLCLMDHCQDMALTKGAVMNEGEMSLRLGLQGWPSSAEDIIVSRNVILSYYTGAHIHMQHISSASAVDIIRDAKERGINVTAEATPHHIALTDDCLHDYNTNYKMNPPLRTERDRQALIAGLLDGTLDIIATDHAPHTDYEKDVEFDYAPFGILGLETSLPVCLETLVASNKTDLSGLIALMCEKPAKLLGLEKGTLTPGVDADIIFFDPEEKWTLNPDKSFSRSSNSPWNGKKLTGRIKRTIVAGETVYDGEKITAKKAGTKV